MSSKLGRGVREIAWETSQGAGRLFPKTHTELARWRQEPYFVHVCAMRGEELPERSSRI
jgi:hypothetical protein